MKIVCVTDQGNAWIVECTEIKHGGLNLYDGEKVIASFPYVETNSVTVGEILPHFKKMIEMAFYAPCDRGFDQADFDEAKEVYERAQKSEG